MLHLDLGVVKYTRTIEREKCNHVTIKLALALYSVVALWDGTIAHAHCIANRARLAPARAQSSHVMNCVLSSDMRDMFSELQ